MVAYPDISFFAFFGVHFCLPHTLCFIFSLLFSGRVPRHFIFCFFRGTFPSFSYIMFHISLAFLFYSTNISFIFLLLFSGCVPRYFILCFFWGTRLLVHHLLWLQHTPICPKRTPTFHFLYFSGYAPSRTSLIMASAHSYSPKTYPNILFLPFLGVQPSTTPSTLFPPPRTKAYSGGVSPQSMLSLASLAFPIVFRQPDAHLPHYLPYTFANRKHISPTTCHTPSPISATPVARSALCLVCLRCL